MLFRIFRYPPDEAAREGWGVGAHTDYGLLTLLQQDAVGGLQVLNRERWLDVPPLADSLVCNVGDMLERLTNGRYLSALHRAKNLSARERLSMVLFLDPAFDAKLEPLPGVEARLEPAAHERALGSHRSARDAGHLRRVPAQQSLEGVSGTGADRSLTAGAQY